VSWSNEDYMRNERESDAYEAQVMAFFGDLGFFNWYVNNEAFRYEPHVARSIESTIITIHQDMRDRAFFALLQLAALAEEAREEAIKLVDDEPVGPPVEPPGHTCFEIDRAQRVMRQLVWRANNPGRALKKDTTALLNEGLEALEAVREENKQMRAAHARATRKVKA
jgi:hypothetical protein